MTLVDIDCAEIYLNKTACEQIKRMPTVDPDDLVKHGEWKHCRIDGGFEIVKCSNCGREAFANAIYVRDGIGCPFCLTKMDGGKNDE